MKYYLTNIKNNVNGVLVRRIRSLMYIPGVAVINQYGGFVESEGNLSHDGCCWIGDDACVFGGAVVEGDALVSGISRVYDNTRVYDKARIGGSAWISGRAKVYEEGVVEGDTWVYGDAEICGTALIMGTATIDGVAKITHGIFRNGHIFKTPGDISFEACGMEFSL